MTTHQGLNPKSGTNQRLVTEKRNGTGDTVSKLDQKLQSPTLGI